MAKQMVSLINWNTNKNILQENNESSKSPEISDMRADTNKASMNHYPLKMQELEERNTNLENLVEKKTKELTDYITTNNKFISILAHDLRGPFCSILGVLGLLKDSLDQYNEAETEKFVTIATDSANRTLNLLDNLLIWTISQNKENNFSPVKINLFEVIKFEIEFAKTSASQKQITLIHSIEPELFVTGDLQMVKTVLRNLIGNGIKYTNIGGEVIISARETELLVEISVKDNGIGISEKALKIYLGKMPFIQQKEPIMKKEME